MTTKRYCKGCTRGIVRDIFGDPQPAYCAYCKFTNVPKYQEEIAELKKTQAGPALDLIEALQKKQLALLEKLVARATQPEQEEAADPPPREVTLQEACKAFDKYFGHNPGVVQQWRNTIEEILHKEGIASTPKRQRLSEQIMQDLFCEKLAEPEPAFEIDPEWAKTIMSGLFPDEAEPEPEPDFEVGKAYPLSCLPVGSVFRWTSKGIVRYRKAADGEAHNDTSVSTVLYDNGYGDVFIWCQRDPVVEYLGVGHIIGLSIHMGEAPKE